MNFHFPFLRVAQVKLDNYFKQTLGEKIKMAFLLAAVLAPVNIVIRVAKGDNVLKTVAEETIHGATAGFRTIVDVAQGENIGDVLVAPAQRTASIIKNGAKRRVIIIDASPDRGALGVGWDVGSALAGVGNGYYVIRAVSWEDAFTQLSTFSNVDEVQFWGHGNPGNAFIGRDPLNEQVAERNAARLRGVFSPNALLWLRTCSSFNTVAGRSFASKLSQSFNVRVAGHTVYIHAIHKGLVHLEVGGTPNWADDSGNWCLATDMSHHSLE